MRLPRCPVHGCQMEYRLAGTYEQRWCGAWYECPFPGCRCSALIPSAELMEIYEAAGKGVEKWQTGMCMG